MSRDKNNLTARQQLFFSELVRGKTFNQILTEHRICPSTILRWTTEASFRSQWEICNQFLALRRATNIATAPLPEPDPHAQPAPSSPVPATPLPLGAVPACQPAPPPKPRPTEREIVERRYGEEGISNYNRLREIRRQQAEEKTVPVPVSAPTETVPEDKTVPVPDVDPGGGPDSPPPRVTNANDPPEPNPPRPDFIAQAAEAAAVPLVQPQPLAPQPEAIP
jgi:hypothetical protein